MSTNKVDRAREFRRDGSRAERLCCELLRGRRLSGVKFRRQHPIGPYFADFACISKKLVIEIDGDHHVFQVEADARRTAATERAGWRVLRFWANEVVQNREGTWAAIEIALSDLHSPLTQPLPPPEERSMKDEGNRPTASHAKKSVSEDPVPTFSLSLADETATEQLGATLAQRLRPRDVVALKGELGAGKTTLARAILRSASADPYLTVPSPTFTLVEVYSTPRGNFWHFDLYRLETPEQVFELGWEDALADGIVLIEWPERLGGLMPKHLGITLEVEGEGRRAILDTTVPAGDA